jgi:hypothetical protein
MTSYPSVTSGVMVTALQQVSRYPLGVLQNVDGTEQRWIKGAKIERFMVSHSGISKADVATLRTFFSGRKGSYDSFDFTVEGATYQNCFFEDDTFRAVETSLGRYSVTLSFRQWRKN